jgi:carbamoyltransferase
MDVQARASRTPQTTIQLELGEFSQGQRDLLVRQHRAFVLPHVAPLLEGLRSAGARLKAPVTVRLDPCEPWGPRPGETAWAYTAAPTPDTGLELLERVLVQLGANAVDPVPAVDGLHRLATNLIRKIVDPTYVSALDLDRPAPSVREMRLQQLSIKRREALICSLAANAHDSSVAIADEEEILIVLEAERVHRHKRKWCSGVELERLAALALAAIGREPADVTHWTGTAMLNGLLPSDRRTCAWTAATPARIFSHRVTFNAVNHHLAHASLAFADLPGRMVVEACDGGGDGRRYAAFAVDGSSIEPVDSPEAALVSGSLYDICSYYLYKEYGQQGKLMGLAAHGNVDDELERFLHDNSAVLSFGSHEEGYELLDRRIGIGRHDPADPRVRDAACSAQRAFVELRVSQAAALAADSDRLVLTGGAALNIHANSAIAAALPDCEVVVPPCCDDTGQALGALLHFAVCELGARPRVPLPFLGLGEGSPREIDTALARRVADDLLAGRVVAWHYGRAEIGPRALGHRSLLCVPYTIKDRVLVSERVKGREAYRPVAPVVLADRLADWFEPAHPSPYMLFAADGTERCRAQAPAVVHVDGSARIQTVDRHEQPLGPILAALEERTGVPLLINTSLNGPGEPIANTAEDTLVFARRHPAMVAWIDGVRHDRS